MVAVVAGWLARSLTLSPKQSLSLSLSGALWHGMAAAISIHSKCGIILKQRCPSHKLARVFSPLSCIAFVTAARRGAGIGKHRAERGGREVAARGEERRGGIRKPFKSNLGLTIVGSGRRWVC